MGENWSVDEGKEIGRLLCLSLGPEYIAHRAGSGGMRVPYIEGWKVINLANEIFGFNGWSSEVRSLSIDYVDEKDGKISMGVSATIRITLKDGTFREDCGYGSIENSRSKSLAYDKCRKEACTDGNKRTLRLFGNALGNCLYDNTFTRHVSKVKTSFKPFNEKDLLRPNTSKSRVGKLPIRAPLPNGFSERPRAPPAQSIPSNIPLLDLEPPAPADSLNDSIPHIDGVPIINSQDFRSDDMNSEDDFVDGLPRVEDKTASQPPAIPEESNLEKTPAPVPTVPEIPVHIGFVSGRAATVVQENKPLSQDVHFDPSFQSPSIRRTLAHNKSVPIRKPSEEATTPSRAPINSFGRTPLGEKVVNLPAAEKPQKAAI